MYVLSCAQVFRETKKQCIEIFCKHGGHFTVKLNFSERSRHLKIEPILIRKVPLEPEFIQDSKTGCRKIFAFNLNYPKVRYIILHFVAICKSINTPPATSEFLFLLPFGKVQLPLVFQIQLPFLDC